MSTGLTRIFLVGHGDFPSALRSSAEMIVGPQDFMTTVALHPEDDPESVASRILDAIEEEGDSTAPIVVLADLFGGSPANAALSVRPAGRSVTVLTGANLGMVIGACEARMGKHRDAVAERALASAHVGLLNATEKIFGKAT